MYPEEDEEDRRIRIAWPPFHEKEILPELLESPSLEEEQDCRLRGDEEKTQLEGYFNISGQISFSWNGSQEIRIRRSSSSSSGYI